LPQVLVLLVITLLTSTNAMLSTKLLPKLHSNYNNNTNNLLTLLSDILWNNMIY